MITALKRNLTLPLLILGIPFLAFISYKAYETRFASLPYLSAPNSGSSSSNQSIPPFSFNNQDNKTVTQKDIENKITVFNFFFANCSSTCPRMMGNETKVADAFKNDTLVKILSITVDPEDDTPQRLKEYCTRFDAGTPQWELLTGNKPDIYRFARNGLNVVATDGDGGPNDFIHSDMLVLVDRQGKIRGYYRGTEADKVDELIRDIQKLEKLK